MRTEKAKQLLTHTDLTIGEISIETGFSSHEHFSRLFRKRIGLSPSAYRRSTQESVRLQAPAQTTTRFAEENVWFHEKFEGGAPSQNWEVRSGRFVAETNCACGEAEEIFAIRLQRALPENFEISLDIQFLFESSERATHFIVSLSDPTESSHSYEITLDAREHDPSELRHWGLVRCITLRIPVQRGEWQKLSLCLFDDTLTVQLDNHRIFAFRNDFPPAYKDRCKVALGCWQSSVRFRNFTVKDLGFPPLIRAVRQGDSLYLAGVYEAAKDFYARLLESDASLSDSMELYYKIGMCFLGLAGYGMARGWFEKVTTPPESDFWSAKARVQELLIDFLLGRDKAQETVVHYFAVTSMRDDLRSVLQRVSLHFSQRGFEACSLSPDNRLVQLEPSGTFFSVSARLRAAETLFLFNRNSEAESCLRPILSSSQAPLRLILEGLLALAHACAIQGRFDEALSLYDAYRSRTSNRFARLRCEVAAALVLRGQNKMVEAVEKLNSVWDLREKAPRVAAYAKLELALLYCAAEDPEKARRQMALAHEIAPGIAWLQIGQRSRYLYVPELISGHWTKGVDLLLEDARFADREIFIHAGQAAKAALMMEAFGEPLEARKIWSEIIRRFPAQQCAFYSVLAQEMLEDKQEKLTAILGGAYERSEMLFLAALVFEKRGDWNKAKFFYEVALKEDPTLRWPACLAKGKIKV